MFGTFFSNLGSAPLIDESCCSFIIDARERNVVHWFWSWRCGIALLIVAACSVTMIAIIPFVSMKNDSALTAESPDSSSSPENHPNDDAESVRFVERSQWIAQPPSEKPRTLSEIPAPYVIISHTATEPCSNHSECVLRVRLIQTFHVESLGWSDIGYNFLIGGDGLAYVARGWDIEGAHAKGWNNRSIGISFIGMFENIVPCEKQFKAGSRVIETGVKLGKISKNYKLLGHRQVSKTLSPGQKIFDMIKKCHHWSDFDYND